MSGLYNKFFFKHPFVGCPLSIPLKNFLFGKTMRRAAASECAEMTWHASALALKVSNGEPRIPSIHGISILDALRRAETCTGEP